MPGTSFDVPRSPAGRGLPRAVDLALALLGLVVSAPVVALAGIVTALSSRGPLLFRQLRVGRNGTLFVLFKLRTMRVGVSGSAVTAGGDPRVTRVGRILRRTKIDELPQVWNVVKGDMALVGPRPEVPDYVDSSDPQWRLVLETRPGITDPVSLRLRFEEDLLASVAGDRADFYRRVMIPFKIFKYLEYQSLRTPQTDVRVLVETLLVGLNGGVAPPYRMEDVKHFTPGTRSA